MELADVLDEVLDGIHRASSELTGNAFEVDPLETQEGIPDDPVLRDLIRQVVNGEISPEDYAEAFVKRSRELERGEAGELRYSSRLKDRLIGRTFPTYKESGGSDANEVATRWAHRDDVLPGDQRLSSYRRGWYVIEAFSDSELGYQIMESVSAHDYDKIAGRIKRENAERRQSVRESFDFDDRGNKPANTNADGRSSIDSNQTQHRGKGAEIQRLGQEQAEWRKAGSDSSGGRESGSSDWGGTGTDRVKFSSKLDTDYFAAVDRGDMDTAQKMVDEAAKAAGYTIKAYHGRGSKFTFFDKSKIGEVFPGISTLGFYFTPYEEDARGYASNWGKDNGNGWRANRYS